MFLQGLEITVEGITDNSKIPRPTRKWLSPLCWDVFAVGLQDLLVGPMSVQVLSKAYAKMELEV